MIREFNAGIPNSSFSSSNVGMFSKDVKMLAALQEEEVDGDRLLDAARRLAGAFSDLLKAAQPGTQEVSTRKTAFSQNFTFIWIFMRSVCNNVTQLVY